MPRDFLPTKDLELLNWSSNFSTMISGSPTSFGLVAGQATAYAALHATYESALSLATEPSTRTRGTISAKNDARTALKAEARELARIIQAFPAITNQQRIDLGLNTRDNEPTPINPPTEMPVLRVVSATGRQMRIKLSSPDSDRRGKPEGVDGATLFSFVGDEPPADTSQWKFEGSTTRTIFDIEFPASVPAGSQVWLTAFWFNPRSQSGPACEPVSAFVAGGVNVAQAA